MTSGILAISASSDLTATSLPNATATPDPKPVSAAGDTVHLSSEAQKHLNAPALEGSDSRGMVEQLVKAAAAGDVGALALLTVA